MMCSLLAPDDVVEKKSTAAIKHGRYGELFSFLTQIDQHKSPGRNTDTPFDMHEFTPTKKQNSILIRLRKYEPAPRGDPNASGSGFIPPVGEMLTECVDDHISGVPYWRMWAVSGDTDHDISPATNDSLSSDSGEIWNNSSMDDPVMYRPKMKE